MSDFFIKNIKIEFDNEQSCDQQKFEDLNKSNEKRASIFSQLDINKDGKITKDEYKVAQDLAKYYDPEAEGALVPLSMEHIKKFGDIDLQNIVIPEGLDLSKSVDVIRHSHFSLETFKHYQNGIDYDSDGDDVNDKNYNPKDVFENGKTIGLGIKAVHEDTSINEKGIKGDGVAYAIIDAGLDPRIKSESTRFSEVYTPDKTNKDGLVNYHGESVASILEEIAPDADCYYYEQHGDGSGKLENLKAIYEKNKQLKKEGKPIIRIISMSMPLFHTPESLARENIPQEVLCPNEKEQIELKITVRLLEEQGCWVYYSGCPENNEMSYSDKIDETKDSNDFSNYSKSKYTTSGDQLHVNSDNRTLRDVNSPGGWRHDSNSSQSWAIPVLAGYYVLACQVDPTMTKSKFMELAAKTAREVDGVKIIDIKALIEAVKNQKTNNNQ